MEKEAAINLFIKQHYKLLTDHSVYDREKLKKIKREFFINKYKISGSVKDKEIIEKLVPAIIKNLSITTTERLEEIIQGNSFLKYSNISADDFSLIINQINKDFTDHEFLRNLEQDKQIEKIKEQIIQEREPELLAEIEQKKQERDILDKELVSILDTMNYEEPTSYDLSESPLEWWEELNLSENPFPNSNGFSMIDEKLYEKILVDTAPYQWMLKKLSTNVDDLFGKGFLVDGALGTGKTTFYDFFKPKFILNNIEPIKLIITEKRSIADYNSDFENQLTKKIKRVYYRHKFSSDSLDYEDLMEELQYSRKVRGFVVFIDDLHKNINEKNVFDFLSNLQLYKNKFIESELKITFFISGLPEWKERIVLDQKLNSFFDGSYSVSMPEVEPIQAATALQRRLLAFSKGESRRFQISTNFLNYIFKNEQKSRNIVGYRAYIDAAKKHFESKQFDVLGLVPMKISIQLTEQIKIDLENNSHFKEALNKLIFAGGRISNHTLDRCLDLLRLIYLEGVISESNKQFNNKTNLMLLKRLADSRLIIKSKFEKGAWKIHPIIEELNKSILAKHSHSFEDYIIQIYGTNRVKQSAHVPDDVARLQKKLNSFSDKMLSNDFQNLRKLADDIFVLYEKEKFTDQRIIPFLNEKNLTTEKLKYLINKMASALLDFETPNISDIYGRGNINNWALRFRNLEYFPDFLHLIDKYYGDPYTDEETAARIVTSAIKTFEEFIGEFESIIHLRQTCNNVPLKSINRQSINSLYNLSEFIRSQSLDDRQFFQITQKYISHFEYSFKEYLFLTSKLIFGDNRFNYYPEHIQLKNYGIDFNGPEDCYNEFNSLERSGFSQIFLNNYPKNSPFFKFIIDPIKSLWRDTDIETLYKIFIEFDKIKSHEEYERIGFVRKNINAFIILSTKLLTDFNDRITNLIFNDSLLFKQHDDLFVAFACKPHGARSPIVEEKKYIDSLPLVTTKHRITDSIKEADLFLDTFFIDNKLELELSNIEELRKIIPGDKYPLQIGVLLYLIQTNKIKFTQVYGMSYYFSRMFNK